MGKSFCNKKGSVTIEACLSFPVFLCLFLVLMFLIRLVSIDVTLGHAADETAKQVAAAVYPVKFINQLENEAFLDNGDYTMIPSFDKELESVKNSLISSSGEYAGNIFSALLTGGISQVGNADSVSADLFKSIFERTLEELKLGMKSYITGKLGTGYYDIKTKLKYMAVKALVEKFVKGGYIHKDRIEYAFIQFPQSTIEHIIRAKDSTYERAWKASGYCPDQQDVVVVLKYRVKIPIPFFDNREIILTHMAVEKAWLNGSNGVYSVDSSGGSAGDDSATLEDNDRVPGSEIVFITETGSKYHKSDCPCLSSSRIPIKLSQAQEKGYQKCRVCSNKGKWNFY